MVFIHGARNKEVKETLIASIHIYSFFLRYLEL